MCMKPHEIGEIVSATVGACLAHYEIPTLYSVDEISEKLKVSKESIRQAISSGELKCYNLGKQMFRLKIADVNAWIESKLIQSGNEEEASTEEEKEPEQQEEVRRESAAEATGNLFEENSDKLDDVDGSDEAEPAATPEPEFVRCPKHSRKTGLQCCLAAGHEGKCQLDPQEKEEK